MKICKNNFDIVVYPVSGCNLCDFGRTIQSCHWFSIFKKASFNCGGITVNSTSDIFKL